MAIIDIIILICFIPAIVQGLMKGFVKQIAGIVAIVGGAWAAYSFSAQVAVWISEALPTLDPKIVSFASYAVIAIIAILALALLGELLTKMMHAVALGPLNRFLGLLFSILKTALILGLLILLFEYLNNALHLVNQETLQNATLYNALKNVDLKLFPFFKDLVLKNV